MKDAYKQLFNLTGKVAVVTGGAGILGSEFCSALADFGAKVAIVDIEESSVTSLEDKIQRDFKVTARGVVCDVTNLRAVRNMVEEVESSLGPIDILVNNAATKGSSLKKFFTDASEYSLDVWREVMAVNLEGVFLVAQTVGSLMAARKRGTIIQTASIYGFLGPDQSIYENSEYLGNKINTPPVYSASKAGVHGLTRYWASFWAASGVRVNSLTPGGVESGQNQQFIENYSSRVPLGRMANVREMVGALIFLSSDASSYVTGQNIMVDGGYSAW